MRISLRARLMLILGALTALPVAFSLVFQDQTLSRDLETAAAARLERATHSARALIESHLQAQAEKYAAVSGTPQFRANLELEDPPTLAHYARSLLDRHDAERIVFLDAQDRVSAAAGRDGLDQVMLQVDGSGIVAYDKRPFAVVSVAIGSKAQPLGRLLAAEPLANATLAQWSDLCGARVWFGHPQSGSPDLVRSTVLSVGSVHMGVESSLSAERDALRHSRRNLLRAGGAAFMIALLASLLLSRKFTAPIRALQTAAGRIGEGDLTVRLPVDRSDELGELSEAVNEMAEQLADQQHALLREKENAEAASRAKSDFLANMSHELRTPLTAILGYSDFLRESNRLGEDETEWATTIARNGSQLLELLDDVLDISRIEAGTIQVQRRNCELGAIFREVIDILGARALDKKVSLSFENTTPIPRSIETDPTRLRQILGNLIANAVKFTNSGGGIRVSVRLQGRALAFSVIDTGIGIAAEHLDGLFEPFSQVDTSHSRSFGGAGLGLAITRQLVERLGGTISVESEPGRGSAFHFDIDPGPIEGVDQIANLGRVLAHTRLACPAREETETHRGDRVLLAEDSPDNRRLVTMILRKAGLEVDQAENGQEAFDMAVQAEQGGEPYRVILMDMQMPILDGYEATRRLRGEGYTGPIVALTAHAMKGDREKCMSCGCDGFVSKPVERSLLLRTVSAYLASKD